MTNRWFLLIDGQVAGPFEENDVESKVHSSPNIKDILIWGKGFPEWVTLMQWKGTKMQIQEKEQSEAPKDPLWKYKFQGVTSQWMNFSDLIQSLKQIKDISAVQVCRDDSDSWQDAYQVGSLVDELGITRRAHPRVPIMGTLDMELPGGNIVGRVISISEGGLGITDSKNITIGQKVKCQLKSPNLFLTINCTCEIVYIGQDGYAGIKFHNLNSEYQSAIIEYVKKFSEMKAT